MPIKNGTAADDNVTPGNWCHHAAAPPTSIIGIVLLVSFWVLLPSLGYTYRHGVLILARRKDCGFWKQIRTKVAMACGHSSTEFPSSCTLHHFMPHDSKCLERRCNRKTNSLTDLEWVSRIFQKKPGRILLLWYHTVVHGTTPIVSKIDTSHKTLLRLVGRRHGSTWRRRPLKKEEVVPTQTKHVHLLSNKIGHYVLQYLKPLQVGVSERWRFPDGEKASGMIRPSLSHWVSKSQLK